MKNSILVAMLVIAFMACSKNENLPPDNPQPPAPSYLPLTVGSYWVYKNYKLIDSVLVETNTIDSVIVESTVNIGGEDFAEVAIYNIFNDTLPPGQAGASLRDSSGYILDSEGLIFMTYTADFNTIVEKDSVYSFLNPDLFLYYYEKVLLEENNPVNVPAGEFDVINFQNTIQGGPINGNNTVTENSFYALEVGRVKKTQLIENPGFQDEFTESHLVKYHIEQ